MRYILTTLIFIMSIPLYAGDWPVDFSQSIYDRCRRVGGDGQCQCVVIRLQEKFTFEDMGLAMRNKIAKEALSQMTRTFNMKCLSKEYKEETTNLKEQHAPKAAGSIRFR